jgi:tripartite-type tricarboxylate transporter receptor subunit TctC
MRRKLATLALLGACLAAPAAQADPVADFYRGRTVQLLIGYSTGGGYDTYARALARYLGKHIPGAPTIVPQNMPGAGSLKLMNFLYTVAPAAAGHGAASPRRGRAGSRRAR